MTDSELILVSTNDPESLFFRADQVFLSPGLFSGELPECTQELMIDVTKSYYQKFLPLTQV